MPYQSIFENYKSFWESDVVKIHLVSLEVIHSFNQDTQRGFIKALHNDKEFQCINIYIDEQYDWETRLRILFHEYGHALHYIEIGVEAANSRKENNLAWLTETESYAFYGELYCSKQISDLGRKDFLINTLNQINERSENYLAGYSEAIQWLKHTPLWNECISLVSVSS